MLNLTICDLRLIAKKKKHSRLSKFVQKSKNSCNKTPTLAPRPIPIKMDELEKREMAEKTVKKTPGVNGVIG